MTAHIDGSEGAGTMGAMTTQEPCRDCGGDHDGYPPGSLGARVRCVKTQAEAIGASHVVDQLDALRRDMAGRIRAALNDPGEGG